MKIIAIRLKNLTSIEGSVEIDFTVEPLSSAGIFAISGAKLSFSSFQYRNDQDSPLCPLCPLRPPW